MVKKKKKKKKIKKKSFIGKEMFSNPQKLKKKKSNYLQGEIISDLFQKSKNLTFQYPKYQLGFFWISRIRWGF